MRIHIYTRIGMTLAALSIGPALAEEVSVNAIMAELATVTAAETVSVAESGSVTVAEPVDVAEPDKVPAAETVDVAEPDKVPAAETVDVAVVTEESRRQFVAGEVDQAEAGFKAVLVADPDNITAALYLRQIGKNRHRQTEEAAMNAVAEAWGSGLELRYYPVVGSALQNMGLANITEPLNIEEKFPFVTFPEGASAIYRPGLKKIFVRNTSANLQMAEDILKNLGLAEQQAAAQQVEVETRFVEFTEGSLEELGFEWSTPEAIDLAGDWSLPLVNDGGANVGQSLFADSLRSVPFTQTQTLGLGEDRATGGWAANRIEDMFNTEAGTLGVAMDFGNNVDLLIRALDQTAGVDVLSAPSIVTLSGEKATITVGERHSYPSVYEEGVSVGNVLHVRYEDFEQKILGVEMDVTPTIIGNDIELEINPKITELAGWQKFQLAPADSSYTYYQFRVGQQYEHEPVVAKLPVFTRREIKTEILVANGATVGMGGLIGETTEAFEDRVPVLGSIPLLGRLFRSEGERSVKRNLMIFVTASKVAPDGRVIANRTFE